MTDPRYATSAPALDQGTARAAPYVWLPLLGALDLLAGCENTDKKPDEPRGNILLQDEHNYQTTASLSIPTVETAPAVDLDVCWTNLVTDIQCHPVAPQADLDNMALLRFLHLSETDVEARLTAGQLAMSEVDGYLDYHTDHTSTCAKLSQLSFFGTPISVKTEYKESTEHTYMLLFAEGTSPGVGARAMTFIKPTASSTNTRVDATAGCGMLDFTARLTSSTVLNVPTAGPWIVDWRDVQHDGQGNDIAFENIDRVMLGFYAGMTAAQLETKIFDIELLATNLWQIELTGGRTANLARATERTSGATFSGFQRADTGLWVLALICSTCQNPAPLVLAILQPGAGGG